MGYRLANENKDIEFIDLEVHLEREYLRVLEESLK